MTDSSDPVLTLSLKPDVHVYWQKWKKGDFKLKYVPSGVKSLTIPVQVCTESGTTKQLQALVDTGAAIPLVVRSGLFPLTEIQKSVWPVKFVTAAGAVMTGGTTGVKLELSFSVSAPSGHVIPGGDLNSRIVVCEPVWAYEAELHKTDLILGYPFLQGFGLAVDPVAGALTLSVAGKICKNPPQCQELSVNAGVQKLISVESKVIDSKVDLKSMLTPVTDLQRYLQDFQKSVYLMKPLVAELYCLFWIVAHCLQQDIQQNCVSMDDDSLKQCQDPECACFEEPDPDKGSCEEWHPSDAAVVAGLRARKPEWFELPDVIQGLKKDYLKLSQKQRSFQKDSWIKETYTVTDEWFKTIVDFSDLEPVVDAFASKGNQRLPQYWTKKDDAFQQDWSSGILWMNPPFTQMDRVVQKILQDEAQGILIIPCWTRCLWFTVLESIAVKWMDIPQDCVLYQSAHGRPLKQRPGWTTRAVVFYAFQALDRMSYRQQMKWRVVPGVDTDNKAFTLRSLLISEYEESIGAVEAPCGLPLDQIKKLTDLLPVEEQARIFSVIESTEEHPEAVPFINKLKEEFHDVLFDVALAKDVDPSTRGPYGVAHIELQPNAVPQKKKPFRMLGEKEAAFRKLIQKFIDRGWIEESDSEWGSQAFLVTKPSAEDPWRMVVDYRYVNTVTKDFPYPLPLIEDLVIKESQAGSLVSLI